VALIFVLIYVPETKGLPIEEVEKMLELRTQHYKSCEKSSGPLEKSQEM
jgi:SP family myo-inositol transporter-like MFS transporter 13